MSPTSSSSARPPPSWVTRKRSPGSCHPVGPGSRGSAGAPGDGTSDINGDSGTRARCPVPSGPPIHRARTDWSGNFFGMAKRSFTHYFGIDGGRWRLELRPSRSSHGTSNTLDPTAKDPGQIQIAAALRGSQAGPRSGGHPGRRRVHGPRGRRSVVIGRRREQIRGIRTDRT